MSTEIESKAGKLRPTQRNRRGRAISLRSFVVPDIDLVARAAVPLILSFVAATRDTKKKDSPASLDQHDGVKR